MFSLCARPCAAQIHWYDEVALVRDGKVLHVLSATGSRGVLPHIHSVRAPSPQSTLVTQHTWCCARLVMQQHAWMPMHTAASWMLP